MAEKQRPLTKSNGLQSHTSENAYIIFPPRVVPMDVKDPTITLWRSVKQGMFNCLSSGSGLASVLRNGLFCSSVVGSYPAVGRDELIDQTCLKSVASPSNRTNSSVLRFTKVGHEP